MTWNRVLIEVVEIYRRHEQGYLNIDLYLKADIVIETYLFCIWLKKKLTTLFPTRESNLVMWFFLGGGELTHPQTSLLLLIPYWTFTLFFTFQIISNLTQSVTVRNFTTPGRAISSQFSRSVLQVLDICDHDLPFYAWKLRQSRFHRHIRE